MNDEILKTDPHKQRKKTFMLFFVVVLAVLSIGAFASFHWLCADYFTFKANEAEARDGLRSTRERIGAEESAARKRLAEIEARVQETEADAKKRVEGVEAAATERIADAEKKASERLAALDEEHGAKKNRLDAEYSAKSKRLEAELEAKKHDIAFVLKDYFERFNEKTNELERVIVAKRAETEEMTKRISLLPDLKKQCEEAEIALAAAMARRDDVLTKEREAQNSFNDWSGKAGQAHAESARRRKERRMASEKSWQPSPGKPMTSL